MSTMMTSPAEILKKPYARVVVPEEDGSFRAEIFEFPGCIALGDTEAEALSSLRNVATSWLEGTIAKGLPVPPPIEDEQFSGKLVLRLQRSLHRRAAHAAKRDGVSLNSYINSALASCVGGSEAIAATPRNNLTVNATTNVTVQVDGTHLLASAGRGSPAQISAGQWDKRRILLGGVEREREPVYG